MTPRSGPTDFAADSAKGAPGIEISRKLVAVNVASSLLLKVLNVSVLIWLQRHLLKRIDPAEYAIYPTVLALMLFAPLMTTVLTAGIGRFLVEACARRDERRVVAIVSTMMPLLALAAIGLLGVGGLVAWNIDKILAIDPAYLWDARFMLALLVFSAAVRVALTPLTMGLYVRQRFVVANLVNLGAEVLRISLLFALLFGISTRVIWVVVATVIANLAGAFATVIASRAVLPSLTFRRCAIDWSLARLLTAFGAWNFVGQVAHTLRSALDPIILKNFAGDLNVTVFHLGQLPFKHINQTSNLATAPLQPPLTAFHATGDRKRLGQAYLRGNRFALWGTLLIVMPVAVFARELVTLWVDSEFITAATVMTMMLLLYPVTHTSYMLSKIAIATAALRTFTLFNLITHLANAALSVYFVVWLQWGAIGVAAAYLITGLACQPLYMPLGIRLADVTWSGWLRESVLWGLIPAGVAAPVMVAIKFGLGPSTLPGVLAAMAAGGIVYCLTILIIAGDYERKLLREAREKIMRVLMGRRGAPAGSSQVIE